MNRNTRYGLMFISPAIAYFLAFWIIPVLMATYYSLTNWKVGRPEAFIGLQNFINLFSDPQFKQSVTISTKITLITVICIIPIALGLAVLLNSIYNRMGRVFRLLIMLPVVTDWVATGLIWQLIFLPYSGVLPGLFLKLGFPSLMGLPWTGSAKLAPFAIVVFIIWKTTGLYAIILLAGLRSIPGHYADAARVDGANEWQMFSRITLPLLRPIMVFVLMSAFVTTVGLFEPIFMLTGGGPADATRVLPLFLYENFFQFQNAGYASAGGIVFLIACLFFALILARFLQYSYYE